MSAMSLLTKYLKGNVIASVNIVKGPARLNPVRLIGDNVVNQGLIRNPTAVIEDAIHVAEQSDIGNGLTLPPTLRELMEKETDVAYLVRGYAYHPIQSIYEDLLNRGRSSSPYMIDCELERTEKSLFGVATITIDGVPLVCQTVEFLRPGALKAAEFGAGGPFDRVVDFPGTTNAFRALNGLKNHAAEMKSPHAALTDGLSTVLVDFGPFFADMSPPEIFFIPFNPLKPQKAFITGTAAGLLRGLKHCGVFLDPIYQRN